VSGVRGKGPRLPGASEGARKAAVAVLQVMSGAATPVQASEALSVSVGRYYQLETRALVAMMKALEPRARGPQRDVERELEELRREKGRAERETSRYQALLRVSQRAMGFSTKPAVGSGKGATKVRRPRVRAKALIAAIGAAPDPGAAPASGEGGAS